MYTYFMILPLRFGRQRASLPPRPLFRQLYLYPMILSYSFLLGTYVPNYFSLISSIRVFLAFAQSISQSANIWERSTGSIMLVYWRDEFFIWGTYY